MVIFKPNLTVSYFILLVCRKGLDLLLSGFLCFPVTCISSSRTLESIRRGGRQGTGRSGNKSSVRQRSVRSMLPRRRRSDVYSVAWNKLMTRHGRILIQKFWNQECLFALCTDVGLAIVKTCKFYKYPPNKSAAFVHRLAHHRFVPYKVNVTYSSHSSCLRNRNQHTHTCKFLFQRICVC